MLLPGWGRCPPRGHAIHSTGQRQDIKCFRRADTQPHFIFRPADSSTSLSLSAARTLDPLHLSAATRLPAPTFQHRIRGVRRADTQPPFHLPPRGHRIHSPVVRRADTRSAPPVSGKTPNVSAARTHATEEQVSGPQNLSEGASISGVARLWHCERAEQFPR